MNIKREKYEIDAAGQAVGRVATKAVSLLYGKNTANFVANIDTGSYVTILNAAKVKFTGKKFIQRDYYRHTMYPGGIRRTPLKKVFENDPGEVIRKAIFGMLPKNKLRNNMMKRLSIKN
jgi:large subunit ribosomal protein L13